MSYTVFARKYRPKKFEEVLGQEHITRTLRNAIEQNRIAHAYIFVGPRGTGKTSTARILAMALNCTNGPRAEFDPNDEVCQEIAQGRSLDVIEIDGASNNGVEQVRELRENIKFAPARGRFKIYIIDEVHMLSQAAFNALLKTLEEPPPHAMFLLATTDVQKVLPTVLSRCQRFDLRRIPAATIASHLRWIADREKISLEAAAADAVARGAEGGLRDAESMLDQLVAFCGDRIVEADVLKVFGFTAQQAIAELCDAILEGDTASALRAVHEHSEAGKDLSRLMTDLIAHLRNLLVLKADSDGLNDELMPEAVAALRTQAGRLPMEKFLELIEQFAVAEQRMKWAPNKKMHFEVAMIRAIQALQSASLTEVLETLAGLRGGSPDGPLPPTRAAAPEPRAKTRTSSPAAKVAEPEVEKEKKTAPDEPAQLAAIDRPSAGSADFWPALVDAVRRDRKLIAGWVEAGALLSIEGEIVQIGFPPEQTIAKEILDESHRPFLEDLATAILGRRAHVRLLIRDGVIATPLPPRPPPRDPMEEFKDDPLIQKAIEIFRAEIQPA